MRNVLSRMRRALSRISALRFRISTQIYLGIGGAVALTVAASLVGWFSFNRVGEAQNVVNEGSVPELTAAFGVAQGSSGLVEAASRLTDASSHDDLLAVIAGIDDQRQALERQLTVLEVLGTDEQRFRRVRLRADTFIENIDAIEEDVADYLVLLEWRETLRSEFVNLRGELERILIPAIDDQLFYTVTGYRDIGEPKDANEAHFNEQEISNYRYLSELLSDTNIATELLSNAFTVSDASLLEPLRERFENVFSRIQRNLDNLRASPYQADLAPIFAQLLAVGSGEETGFNLLERSLRLEGRQISLTQLNRDIAIALIADVDDLVGAAQANSEVATNASSQAILAGRSLLLFISAISVAGAVLIAWLFVGRVLLRRLHALSNRMLRMADGDLEAPVEITGKDEIADMAWALEVFRNHALEVQRLNLVEELAKEVQGKNEELEIVLDDLRAAQNQIVAREKLAALGELTAGVAHEIRNPLNFVKNFSEASTELLEELRETMEETENSTLTKEQASLIMEISQDLNDNLQRIRNHGERANRIVESMLSMGRGATEPRLADINSLLDEHTRLAYHSARATDPEFQLHIEQNLDPNMGEVEVVPQDIGRVFLNLVNNSCYATDQKRRAQETADGGYMPTVSLTTLRKENTAEIRIRDNGSGMPKDVIEKIFNPFFTTKPTDQGTGLGLAICNDIIRSHGGTIEVTSQHGEYTEMVVEIPLEINNSGLQETEEELAQ